MEQIKTRQKKHKTDLVIGGFILGFLFGLGFPSMPEDPGWWYFSTFFSESAGLYILFHSVFGGLIGYFLSRLINRKYRQKIK